MALESGFGGLRSLMQEAPSESVWTRLVALLDAWPRETLESEALPYVCDHLRRWPEELDRCAPYRWEAEAFEAGSSPRLLACATLWLQFDRVEEEQLERLLRCPHARNLRTINLDLSECGMSAENMSLLASSASFDALKTLSLEMALDRGERGLETLRILASARRLPGLRRLSLMANELTAEALRVLRSGGFLERLTHLDLAYNNFEGGAAAHLDGMRWERIEWLDLRCCELVDEDARALARLDAPRLHTLLLSTNHLTRAGAEALLASASLPALAHMQLKGGELALEDRDALVVLAAQRGVSLVTYDEEEEGVYMLQSVHKL
jgi:hypothetical protein